MKAEKSKQIYCLFVNSKEMYQVAKAKGHENVILCTEDSLPFEDLIAIKDSGLIALMYSNEDKIHQSHHYAQLSDQLRTLGVSVVLYNGIAESLDEAEEEIPDVRRAKNIMISRGYMLQTDYTDRCGNCHEYMSKEDKFCKYCGTRRGEGKFRPFENRISLLYGPPMKVKYTCQSCGHSWTYRATGNPKKSKYCPACRAKKIKAGETRVAWFDETSEE